MVISNKQIQLLLPLTQAMELWPLKAWFHNYMPACGQSAKSDDIKRKEKEKLIDNTARNAI